MDSALYLYGDDLHQWHEADERDDCLEAFPDFVAVALVRGRPIAERHNPPAKSRPVFGPASVCFVTFPQPGPQPGGKPESVPQKWHGKAESTCAF